MISANEFGRAEIVKVRYGVGLNQESDQLKNTDCANEGEVESCGKRESECSCYCETLVTGK